MKQTIFPFGLPTAATGELPTSYADHIGSWCVAQRDDEQRKKMGLYLTPVIVAQFMATMMTCRNNHLRILDPAAGCGILLCAAIERIVASTKPPEIVEIVAYELDSDLVEPLQMVLKYLKTWAAKQGIQLRITVRNEDFILAQASALSGEATEKFDVVIANPPYFKIAKEDPRAVAARLVVHGQPNIYGLFMAVAAALTVDCGDAIFITPRSFASGPYFRRFRENFFSVVRPAHVHLFSSRRIAFSRDDVLQENIIIHAIREPNWSKRKGCEPCMTISTSNGIDDIAHLSKRSVLVREVLNLSDVDTVLRLPETLEEEGLLRWVDSWEGSLQGYGLQISTGPVVPFRATKWLKEKNNSNTVPLLWMNHVQAMEVHWPNGCRKAQYILKNDGSEGLLLANRNYVLLRRFSAKEERRRLTAAPFLAKSVKAEFVGIENHLNYIHRPGGSLTEDEAWGLSALYSSALLDGYFRCINGNTQVSATELRAMPLPPLKTIVAIGKRVQSISDPLQVIDDLVDKFVGSVSDMMVCEGERAVG